MTRQEVKYKDCHACKGTRATREGRITITNQEAREPCLVRNLPVTICSQCGEHEPTAGGRRFLEEIRSGRAEPTGRDQQLNIFDFEKVHPEEEETG